MGLLLLFGVGVAVVLFAGSSRAADPSPDLPKGDQPKAPPVRPKQPPVADDNQRRWCEETAQLAIESAQGSDLSDPAQRNGAVATFRDVERQCRACCPDVADEMAHYANQIDRVAG